jgi:hypothetical protein
MSDKTLNIYWLDDQVVRFQEFKQLLEESGQDFALDVHLNTIEVDKNIMSLISAWEENVPTPAPDLFMLDHIFVEHLPLRMNGNTLAHLLRIIFPSVPLVSVTAMYADRNQSGQDVHEYTAIFHYNKLSDCLEELYSVARDYPRLKFPTWEAFVGELHVPDSECSVLRMAIPQELLEEYTPTKHSQLVKWVRTVLLQNPGFLFDELHAATFLGLSVAGFQKVKPMFAEALYRGPFATSSRPVWWQTRLRDCLYQIVGAVAPDYSQAAGRLIIEFEEADFCRCYVTGVTDATDFVVAEAHPNQIWVVVRERCAKKNPNGIGMPLGFNQALIIDGQ